MKQIRDCPSCIIFYASRASRVQGTSAVNVCTYGWSNRLTNFENETETCFFVFLPLNHGVVRGCLVAGSIACGGS